MFTHHEWGYCYETCDKPIDLTNRIKLDITYDWNIIFKDNKHE
jgi:hypothetical protein